MKITSVEIFKLKPGVAQSPFPIKPVVCRLNTDEDICGYGEAGVSTGIGENAVFGMVQDLAPLLIGRDPFDNDVFWEDVKNMMYGHLSGGGVVVWSALSAFDVAMMDIKGRRLNVPCYKLLGGKFNDRLPTYASHVQSGWGDDIGPRGPAKEYADVAEKVKNLGYTMLKCDFVAFDRERQPLSRRVTAHALSKRDLMKLVEERLYAIRERVGDEMDILIDSLCRLDISGSLALDELATKYRCTLLEECIDPFKPSQYRLLAEKCRTPLAAGEKVHTRWGYSTYFEQGGLRMIQPDIANCGGLSEAKKICDMAHVYDVKVQAHACGTPLTVAAALHLEAAIPNFAVHEHFFFSDHADVTGYCEHSYPIVNGMASVPERPGLGNALSEKAMREAQARLVIA